MTRTAAWGLVLSLLSGLVLLLAVPAAQARIVVQQSIKGIRLGRTVSQVRARLGPPDRIVFRRDPIQGRVRVYAYGLTRASFSPGDASARVNVITTRSRRERTARGVGVGSRRAQVAARVRGVRCRVEFGVDHCFVGSFVPGRRVTDFRIGPTGRVRSVTVGFVID
jgi:hypothetical protein